ncbi:hypothetical protein H7X46_03380 [Pseudonocardia sp. C8]|uniref:hypothetical protein n=1 Tax=Pseudonocardia sp. C8 TaxID=2762759 RepID=UPI001642EA63|nr:hypothetical protein [Pseudonocardia sp. C8]MBC3190103.1 hypothetical protein [Pseudonocardia sp. C8]
MTAERVNDADMPEVLTLTSVIDSRAHKVTDSELCAPHAMRNGRYAALCGHLVSPAPLIEADGAPCARCVQLDPTPPATPPRRPRRRGWGLRRLLAV